MYAIPALDDRPPEHDTVLDHIGGKTNYYLILQGTYGPYLLDHTGDLPHDLDVMRAGPRNAGLRLNCGHLLQRGSLFIIDDNTGETGCPDCYHNNLIADEGDEPLD